MTNNDAAERLLARIETLRQPDVLSTEQYRLVKMDLDAALAAERRAGVEGLVPPRWLLPDKEPDRVEIDIHPVARQALIRFLMDDERMMGVGYSEFVMRSINLWRAILDAEGKREGFTMPYTSAGAIDAEAER